MTSLVAHLWVDHALAPADVIAAPPEVLAVATQLLERRARQRQDAATFAALEAELRRAGL
ncbi:MAG: hypothetical protein QOK39_113 [Acidimicrobiaceae bacterium]|jgi:hypothetical protein|nr:hypothetical protein [Acidimicrobiaceae bacterium]